VDELIDERVALADYQLKTQVQPFWEFLRIVQGIRQGMRTGSTKDEPLTNKQQTHAESD
jgi:hypothetical protein